MPLNPFKAAPREHPPAPELTASLRKQWLDGTMTSKAPVDASHTDLLAVLTDVGVGTGLVTFVSAYDGHASLYTDTGGGIIGAGFHVPSAAASLALIGCAESYISALPTVTEFPPPRPGQRSFWIVSRHVVRGITVLQNEVKQDSPIQPLYAASENVITNLRLVDTRLKKGTSEGPADHIHIFSDGGICFLTYGNSTPTFLTLAQLGLVSGIAKQREDQLNVSAAHGDGRLEQPAIDTIKESGASTSNVTPPAGLVLPKGESTLHHAVITSRVDIIRDLIQRGVDTEQRDVAGYTPLAVAAYFGRVEALKTLISLRANVTAQDNQGNSVLMFAAQWGNPESVRILIQSGADTAARANNRYTALKVARLCSQSKVVHLLESLKAPE